MTEPRQNEVVLPDCCIIWRCKLPRAEGRLMCTGHDSLPMPTIRDSRSPEERNRRRQELRATNPEWAEKERRRKREYERKKRREAKRQAELAETGEILEQTL